MYWDTRWQLAGAGKELCPNAFSSQRTTVSFSQVMIQCSLVLEASVFTTDTLRIFSESIQCQRRQAHHKRAGVGHVALHLVDERIRPPTPFPPCRTTPCTAAAPDVLAAVARAVAARNVWLMNMRALRGSTSLSFRLWLGTTTSLALADRLIGFSLQFNLTQSSSLGLQLLSAADDLYGSQHWYLVPSIPVPINASTQRAAKANMPSSLLGTTSACEKKSAGSSCCMLPSVEAKTWGKGPRMETAQRNDARSMHKFCTRGPDCNTRQRRFAGCSDMTLAMMPMCAKGRAYTA